MGYKMPLAQWIKIGFPCSATERSPQDNVSNENTVIPFKIIAVNIVTILTNWKKKYRTLKIQYFIELLTEAFSPLQGFK